MFKVKGLTPVTFLLLVIIIGISSVLSGFYSPTITKTQPKDEKLIVLERKGGYSSEKGLQIDTLRFATIPPKAPPPPPPPPPPDQPSDVELPPMDYIPPPPPGDSCYGNVVTPECPCTPGTYPNKVLICDANDPVACPGKQKAPDGYDENGGFCNYASPKQKNYPSNLESNPNCHIDPNQYCMSKPIIYLYPTKKTLVDVRLEIPGEVVISDPLYPIGGWKNVEAHPDGTLYYQGKKYRELYYESTSEKLNIPQNGIIIPKEKLREELNSATTKLGLNDFEQKEFVDYWVGRFNELDFPYVLFSILDKDEKERIDHVVITPEPDTRIEFMAYFKPLKKPISIAPLVLSDPPKRIGFTEVEWGGILDLN